MLSAAWSHFKCPITKEELVNVIIWLISNVFNFALSQSNHTNQLLLLLRRENYSLPFIIIIIIVIASIVVKDWIDPIIDNSTSNPEESWHAEVEKVLRDVNESIVRLKDGLQVNRDVHTRNAAPSGLSGLFIWLGIWKNVFCYIYSEFQGFRS